MVTLDKMTLLNIASRNMQVQDLYGSSQQLTSLTKLLELKFLEYLYQQVLIKFVDQTQQGQIQEFSMGRVGGGLDLGVAESVGHQVPTKCCSL